MTTQALARRRRPRGQYPRGTDQELQPRPLPQYLEAHEVNSIIGAADDPRARLSDAGAVESRSARLRSPGA